MRPSARRKHRVLLAQLAPWDLAEEIYHVGLDPDQGAPIKSARVALGALLIKEKLGLTVRDTVAAIQENPYMQFFIGFEEFTSTAGLFCSLQLLIVFETVARRSMLR